MFGRLTSFALAISFVTGVAANAQSWLQVAVAPAISPPARQFHAMAYDTASGQLVLFGGLDAGDNLLGDTWTWDGANWTQKHPAASPPVRWGHAMAYDSAHSQVVLFGGFDGVNDLGDTWVWDGTNWTNKTPGPVNPGPSPRFGHAMTYDAAHGQVVLFGGGGHIFGGIGSLSDTWVWNGTIWTQKSVAAPPPGRDLHAMAYDAGHSQVVLFGGQDQGGNLLSDTWLWDGTGWTQQSPGAIPPPRSNHTMAYDSTQGQVVLFGGYITTTSFLADTWQWDGTNWASEGPSTSPPARDDHAMAFDSQHAQMVLFGGVTSSNQTLSDTWIFYRASFSNWNQRSPAASPPATPGIGGVGAMAYDAAHMQTVFLDALSGATWLWDGTSWTQSATPSPGARPGFAMAYDAQHDKVVLFGGILNELALNDTWLWDGTNWSKASPSTIPAGRGYHAMAYDAARQQVVMNGGLSAESILFGPYFFDTWVWDGTNWTEKANGFGGAFHAMAYDVAHAQVVRFGGSSGGAPVNVTAVWDGTSWTQTSPVASPSGRQEHAMVYDAALGQIVLFGGMNGSTANLGDTWLWDGTNWTQQSSTANPSGRHSHAMAYDSVRQQVVLFGGNMGGGLFGSSTIFSDTWSWEAFSATPNRGSGTGPQVFNATYFDNNGASDLQVAYLDFGSVGDAPNSCKLSYAAGTVNLFNDGNTGVIGSVFLGGGSSVSNSQCTVFGGSTAATLLGNNLIVPFDIQFKAGFAGQKTIFGMAETVNGTFSNGGAFQTLGTWTPAASTPSGLILRSPDGTKCARITVSDTGALVTTSINCP
jgi:hypothetical protein